MQGASIGKWGPSGLPARALVIGKPGNLCYHKSRWRRSVLVCVGWGRVGGSQRQLPIPAVEPSPSHLQTRNSRYLSPLTSPPLMLMAL